MTVYLFLKGGKIYSWTKLVIASDIDSHQLWGSSNLDETKYFARYSGKTKTPNSWKPCTYMHTQIISYLQQFRVIRDHLSQNARQQ